MKQLFIFTTICMFIFSCSKKSNDKDTETSVVTFSSPANNQVFTAGETIHIKGIVNDNQYIDEVHIEISNLNTGIEYQHVHIHPATKTYAFDQPLTVQAGINYKIKVIAEDPSSNTSSQQVEISCN